MFLNNLLLYYQEIMFKKKNHQINWDLFHHRFIRDIKIKKNW